MHITSVVEQNFFRIVELFVIKLYSLTAMLHVSNDILWAMENQSTTSLIAMDLSAAFDTVDHDILLTILKCKFSLEHEALKWFDRYLCLRSYKVIVNGKYSREIDLSVSVPQGNCAGANIFNLYCAPYKKWLQMTYR